jgi:sulfatase modifying factor 1
LPDGRPKARFKDNDPSGVKAVDRDAFPANGFGLHNMAGNVAEWVHDYYATYADGPAKNPTGPVSGSQRSARGGSFDSNVSELRVASRSKLDPSKVESSVGFRIVIK